MEHIFVLLTLVMLLFVSIAFWITIVVAQKWRQKLLLMGMFAVMVGGSFWLFLTL